MSQEFQEPEYKSNEHLTDDEVEAIVKRYGESQSGGSMQPTVKDVAEALHVDAGVVSQLLTDVRSAKTQEDLKARLDALEAENTELRERAEKTDYHANQMWDDFSGLRPLRPLRPLRSRHAPRLMIVFAAIFLAAIFASRGAAFSGGSRPTIWIILGLVVIFAIIKRLGYLRR